MWTKINVSPEPYGICTICSKHDCGHYVDEEGNKQEGWLVFNHEMYVGGHLTIGYNCVKSMCDDLAINKIIVKETIYQEPTPEHVYAVLQKGMEQVEKEKEKEFNRQARKLLRSDVK